MLTLRMHCLSMFIIVDAKISYQEDTGITFLKTIGISNRFKPVYQAHLMSINHIPVDLSCQSCRASHLGKPGYR